MKYVFKSVIHVLSLFQRYLTVYYSYIYYNINLFREKNLIFQAYDPINSYFFVSRMIKYTTPTPSFAGNKRSHRVVDKTQTHE